MAVSASMYYPQEAVTVAKVEESVCLVCFWLKGCEVFSGLETRGGKGEARLRSVTFHQLKTADETHS